MNFSDAKTDEIMMELRIAAKGNIDIMDKAMYIALIEAKNNNEKSVKPKRIKEIIAELNENIQ